MIASGEPAVVRGRDREDVRLADIGSAARNGRGDRGSRRGSRNFEVDAGFFEQADRLPVEHLCPGVDLRRHDANRRQLLRRRGGYREREGERAENEAVNHRGGFACVNHLSLLAFCLVHVSASVDDDRAITCRIARGALAIEIALRAHDGVVDVTAEHLAQRERFGSGRRRFDVIFTQRPRG